MSPQRKRGQLFFERRFSFVLKGLDTFSKGLLDLGFSKGRWIWFFLSDFGLWTGFSKGRGSGFSFGLGLWTWFFKGMWIWFFFSDLGQLDGLTKEYGLVFRTLDWFFFRTLELVFLSDFGYFNLVCLTT